MSANPNARSIRPAAPVFRGQGNVAFRSEERTKVLSRGQTVPYNVNGAPAGGYLADGDYGDIVIASGGTAITIDTAVLTAYGRTLTAAANAAAARSALGLTIGSNVQAWDADLDSIAALAKAGNALKVVRVKGDETGYELAPDATGGSSGYSVVSKSATYSETATSGELIILASGTFTINLPTAGGNTAKITVKLVAAGTVTLDGSGGQTIDGSTTAPISVVNTAVSIVSDNANWQIV